MDFGSLDEFDYIIMPYIEGVSFQEKMESVTFEWGDALKLMIPMVDAIIHAHKKRIIHRDIKPSNYMINSQGRIILTDFGVSKHLGDATMTAAHTILGSPKFMSPEQISGGGLSGQKVDNRSDLYSLGMVFYQLLTGVYPFACVDISSLTYNQVHKMPEHPHYVNKNVPKVIGDIIMKLVEKDPDNRYPDGETLLEDLRKCFTHQKDLSKVKIFSCKPEPESKMEETVVGKIKPIQKTIIRRIDKKKDRIPPAAIVEKRSKRKIWGLSAAGITFVVLFAGMILILVMKNRQDDISSEKMTQKISDEYVAEKEPAASFPQKEKLTQFDRFAGIGDIRVEPTFISETIEAGSLVAKTIKVYNDSQAALSEINIMTESDGSPAFLGPVSRTSFNVGEGDSASFTCSINAAYSSPGDIRTGRIQIFSNDPDDNPKTIEVRLTVAESTAVQLANKLKKFVKPAKSIVTLRSKNFMEKELLKNIKNFHGTITAADAVHFLKLKVGFRQTGKINQHMETEMKAFLANLSYAELTNNGECDILISLGDE